MTQVSPLSKRRILVVEDEFFLADELHRELEAVGAVVIGPAPTVKKALALVEEEAPIDAALLDVNLGGEMVFPVAEALVVRSVPFVFTSSYGNNVLAKRFALMPRCPKPTDITSIINQLTVILPAVTSTTLAVSVCEVWPRSSHNEGSAWVEAERRGRGWLA